MNAPTRPSRRRKLSIQWLQSRRLLAVLTAADLTPMQSGHVASLQANCNTTDQSLVFYEDFEAGFGGFTADNTGGSLPGLWHRSIGRNADGLPNHSPDNNFYYGLFETAVGGGRFDTLPLDHQGTLVSPAIAIPAGVNTLSFNHFLHTRESLDLDFVDVTIVDLDTPSNPPVQLLSRQSGSLPMTDRVWQAQCVEIPESFSGGNIELRFTFDTGDTPNVDPEGWYVDDILITNRAEVVDPPPLHAAVRLTKGVSDPAPEVGQTVTFTITVSNPDPSPVASEALTVSDVLPAGVTLLEVIADEGSYDPVTGQWTGVELSIDETRTLSLRVRVDSGNVGRTITNTATLGTLNATASFVPQPAEQLVQFITPLSVFRAGPLMGLAPEINPPGQITGFLWADIDVDGLWDADEQPRIGFQVFLDLNDDGVFDPETEPDAVSDAAGRYSFSGLDPGDYSIREVDFERGTIFRATFPANGLHRVTVTADGGPQGNPNVAQPPNFGVFEFSTLVRPADQFFEFSTEFPLLARSLSAWQSFDVANDTDMPFSISEFNFDDIAVLEELDPIERNFVTVVRVEGDGSLATVSLPLVVPAGQAISLIAIYDPAIRVDGRVTRQRPDWFGPEPRDGFHTFAADDRLVVITDVGLRFPVKLVGGSTFDSDITHDGVVDFEDVALINALLSIKSPIVRGDPAFDPTTDINARCPNGADAFTGSCQFGAGEAPRRELGLGDFGPLNVESVLPPRSPVALAGSFPPGVTVDETPMAEILIGSSLSASVRVASGKAASDPSLAWKMDEHSCDAHPSPVSMPVAAPDETPQEPIVCWVDAWDRDEERVKDELEEELESVIAALV